MRLLKGTLATLVLAGIALAASTAYAAEKFPTKPIRVVVPFPPGAVPKNIIAGLNANVVKILGQQVVREQFLKGARSRHSVRLKIF